MIQRASLTLFNDTVDIYHKSNFLITGLLLLVLLACGIAGRPEVLLLT